MVRNSEGNRGHEGNRGQACYIAIFFAACEIAETQTWHRFHFGPDAIRGGHPVRLRPPIGAGPVRRENCRIAGLTPFLFDQANALQATAEFNEMVDGLSPFELKDWTADIQSGRDNGTVTSSGMVHVPEGVSTGAMGISIPGTQASGDSYTYRNSAGVAYAEKANQQKMLLNEMQSTSSVQRAAFIKANEGRSYTVYRNGKPMERLVMGSKNAGIVYDNAVNWGRQVGMAQLK